MIGYAFCGSFCTHKRSLLAMEELLRRGYEIQPIMSENVYTTDTRFGKAADLIKTVEECCGRPVIHSIVDAEPLGPAKPLDSLIIAPCTGNTLAKIASGITDTAVTMAAKAHLRSDRRLLIALATNDAMSSNLENVGRMLMRRSVYMLPMCQDDPVSKPHSLVARMELIPDALSAMERGEQLRPIFI